MCALAVDHLVGYHVVPVLFGARVLVVVGVLPAPHDAAGLIGAPLQRAEAHLHEAVLDGGAADGPAEVGAAAVHELSLGDVPARAAASRRARLPCVGHLRLRSA